MELTTFSIARNEDIDQLVQLINSAYRGEEARKGWTHEADLIEGTKRTDEASIKELIQNPKAVMLTCWEQNRIIGCVYLEKSGHRLYLGMLSVSPAIQGRGTGKKLLRAAEEYAKDNHCSLIEMTVISVRKELIDWYERNGYKKTGLTRPFPDDERFGKARQKIDFIVLEKKIQ